MGNNKNLEYKLFCSEDYDWFIAAKNCDDEVKVLYSGDKKGEAYKSILKDIGIKVNIEEREMKDNEGYIPTKDDFK